MSPYFKLTRLLDGRSTSPMNAPAEISGGRKQTAIRPKLATDVGPPKRPSDAEPTPVSQVAGCSGFGLKKPRRERGPRGVPLTAVTARARQTCGRAKLMKMANFGGILVVLRAV